MKHQLSFNTHTILVRFEGELTSIQAEILCIRVIKHIVSVSHPLNVIMDATHGFTKHSFPVLKFARRLFPFLRHFNCCYIIGTRSVNFKYALKFFKKIGAARDKVFFMENISEAVEDIQSKWSNYLISH